MKLLSRLVVVLTIILCIPAINAQDISTKNTADNSFVSVVIVGGGLTGLITAYELKKSAIPFVLLESNNRLGGRVNTIYYPDHAIAEAHMEEFWERTPNYNLLKELKVPLVEDCSYSSIIINHKIYPHQGLCDGEYLHSIFTPEEYKAFQHWSNHTWSIYETLSHSAEDIKLSPEIKKLMTISFADYVKKFNLPDKVNEWIRINLEMEASVNWNEISALDGIDEFRIFIGPANQYAEKNYHVAGGNNNYIYALRDQLPKQSIKTQAFVKQIIQHKNYVTTVYIDNHHQLHAIKSFYTVIAVPLFSLSKIQFTPILPQEKLKAISTTAFASYIKVNYRVKPEATQLWIQYKKDGLFTLLTDQVIGAIYDSTTDEDVAKGKDLVMTVLIGGQQAKAWSKLSKQEILKLTAARMNLLFPHFSDYITQQRVDVYPTAIAYWPLAEHRSRFDALAIQLRQPFDRIQIGSDTTEDSHSEGASRAALRMSDYLIQQLHKTDQQKN